MFRQNLKSNMTPVNKSNSPKVFELTHDIGAVVWISCFLQLICTISGSVVVWLYEHFRFILMCLTYWLMQEPQVCYGYQT